jgi:hypothetical protein
MYQSWDIVSNDYASAMESNANKIFNSNISSDRSSILPSDMTAKTLDALCKTNCANIDKEEQRISIFLMQIR